MTTRTTQIPFDELLERAAAESRRRRREALPPEKVLRREHDFSALDRRMTAWLKQQRRARAEKTMPRRTSLRTLKRIALAAALLAALFLGALTVSAQLRAYVKNIIIEWTDHNVGIRYEVDGALLTELPEGYGPHYIPEEYLYDEKNSFVDQSRFSFVYRYKEDEGKKLMIDGCISENASMVWTDNEHISYEWVTVNDVPAYLGTFIEREGYTLDWAKDGIEHSIYFETDLSIDELYKIAENIY